MVLAVVLAVGEAIEAAEVAAEEEEEEMVVVVVVVVVVVAAAVADAPEALKTS